MVEVSEAAPRFHSRLNATGKRYRYRIINSQIPDVFWRRYATEEPETLDLDAMRKAAELLLGSTISRHLPLRRKVRNPPSAGSTRSGSNG